MFTGAFPFLRGRAVEIGGGGGGGADSGIFCLLDLDFEDPVGRVSGVLVSSVEAFRLRVVRAGVVLCGWVGDTAAGVAASTAPVESNVEVLPA